MDTPRTRAVRELVAAYPALAPALRAFAARLGVTESSAEDVVADAFATVLTLDDDRLAGIGNLRAYLYAVVRNAAARWARSAARIVPTPDDALDRGEPATASREVEQAQSAALARRAFAALGDRQRHVLWATLVERRQAADLAHELGTTVSNVTTQAQRARAALRQQYVTAFLELAPPTCDLAPATLARVALGTASPRQEREYHRHVRTCARCPELARRAAEDLTAGSVARAVALGGLPAAAGAAGAAGAPLPTRRRLPRSAPRRTAVGAAGIVAAVVLVLLVLLSAGPLPGRPGGATPTLRDRVAEPASVSVTAEPDRVRLAMPAPGGEATWTSAVTSGSDAPLALLLAVAPPEADHPSGEPTLTLSVARDGVAVASGVVPGAAGFLHLGRIDPGETTTVVLTVRRAESDRVQGLAASSVARFVVTDEVPAGAAAGALIDPGAALAVTGAGTTWRTALLAVGAVAVGAVLLSGQRGRVRWT